MTTIPVLSLPDLPLCIGACDTPHNPAPLPDTFPFELCLDDRLGRLEAQGSDGLDEILRAAYALGIEMGTPSADTDLGRPYVLDFLAFVERSTERPGTALEIGAGVGYLSSLLAQRGWQVQSVEPGEGYRPYWERYGVDVVNDFFPSPQAPGPYDLVVLYTVLEHIRDVRAFLGSVVDHLRPEGRMILAVPDCSAEIAAGDPSMLLHEHYHYFTPASLQRTLWDAGFEAHVEASGYGRSLYACAAPGVAGRDAGLSEAEIGALEAYGPGVRALRSRFGDVLRAAERRGSVGVYCPARALALLPHACTARFFDDAAGLHGKFYPPFDAPVESRAALLADPPETLLILSRTFGDRLKAALAPALPSVTIRTLNDLFQDDLR